MATASKNDIRVRIHKRIRQRVAGTEVRPRLAVYRSLKHIYAQLIDDSKGVTVVSASSSIKDGPKNGGNVAGAKEVGKLIAERAKEKGVTKVVFDRGGYIYQGRVANLAEGAREAGLEF